MYTLIDEVHMDLINMLVSFSIWWVSFPNELEAHNYQSIGECVEKQKVLRECAVHFSTKVYIMQIMYSTEELKISLPITKYILIVVILPISITAIPLLKCLLSYRNAFFTRLLQWTR